MDGFYVAKFKVERRVKVNGGEKEKEEERIEVDEEFMPEGSKVESGATFDEDEDRPYLEGTFGHYWLLSNQIADSFFNRGKAETHESKRSPPTTSDKIARRCESLALRCHCLCRSPQNVRYVRLTTTTPVLYSTSLAL